jgi:hypothetical protein
MQDWSIPLVIATAAFLAVLVWRVRPALPWSSGKKTARAAMRDAKARVERATTDAERGLALCEAGELAVRSALGANGAMGLFMRAMRADPQSVQLVERAAAALARRPRLLESILWRRLGAGPWRGEPLAATLAALDALSALYEGPLRNSVRARAMAHARDALAAAALAPAPAPAQASPGRPEDGG